MNKKIEFNIKSVIVLVFVICILAASSSYAATTYAINSNNVEYEDNSNLGVTNVQAAIDGTCSKMIQD